MGKYVFECSVREVILEKAQETLHLIPDTSFSAKRKDDSGEKTFTVFLPMGGTQKGKVFEYGKFVEMEIKGQGWPCLTNVGIGMDSKLCLELDDGASAVANSTHSIKVLGKRKMAVTKIVIR